MKIKNTQVRASSITYHALGIRSLSVNCHTSGRSSEKKGLTFRLDCSRPGATTRGSVDGPLLTHKMSLVRNLGLIIPEVYKGGALSSWGFHALDTDHWHDLLATLKHPENTTPDVPPDKSDGDADTHPFSNTELPPPSPPPPPSHSPPPRTPPPHTSRDHCNSGGTEENSRSPPSPPPPMTPPNRS